MTAAPSTYEEGDLVPAEHIDTIIKIASMVVAGVGALWKIGVYFAELRTDIRGLGEKLGSLSERAAAVEAKVGELSVRVARLEDHEERPRGS